MPLTLDALAEEALHLPPDQRMTLANRLLTSVEPPVSPEAEAAWDTEIRERILKYRRGETQTVPASRVFAEIDRRLGE